ncbi:MAG: DegQ family serine endoprotease [Burkholderiaceae bacterium]|nr:DegQ family serine endoprotease [Burkholderiaceae bacterium]
MAQSFLRTKITLAVAAALASGFLVSEATHSASLSARPAAAATLPLAHDVAAGIAAPTDFSGIVDKFGPAVVNISVTGKVERVEPNFPQMDPDDPFYQFFRHFDPRMQPHGEGQIVPHAEGSGFIVTADGYILTNAHVVDGASEVTVKLTDRREFKAKVVGTDKRSDVAVIKIDGKNLPTVVLGDPNLTKVGEPVLAIGSPFGFENSATAGIVSAKSRTLPDDPYVSFMQTDVAVNPGNSGGPLFNLKGEVIGINSQIYSRTGGYQGLSFAIPIDVANKVQAQLVAHGKVTRGRLGVSIQEVDQSLADSFGLKQAGGALVSSVEKSSPAAKAGIEAGDVIVGVDGKPIDHSAELSTLISEMAPGTAAKLDVIRKGENRSIKVVVGEMPSSGDLAHEDGSTDKGRLGVLVRPLAPREKEDGGNGVVVERSAGPAARAGIRPGDVILSLNGKPVKDPEQLQQLVQQAGHKAAVLIQRNEAHIFIPVELG